MKGKILRSGLYSEWYLKRKTQTKGSSMNDSYVFVGIDYHKRYSVISAVDSAGRRLLEARVNGNTPDGFRAALCRLPAPAKVAVEACWNWGKLHDILEELPEVEEIVLSHPYKTRIIAESQIKTDKSTRASWRSFYAATSSAAPTPLPVMCEH
jgi:hypothetical protein